MLRHPSTHFTTPLRSFQASLTQLSIPQFATYSTYSTLVDSITSTFAELGNSSRLWQTIRLNVALDTDHCHRNIISKLPSPRRLYFILDRPEPLHLLLPQIGRFLKAAEASSSHATLNYHIPTPDATGLVESADYAKLYQTHLYHEPHGYIRFSDTVEESSCGQGGLGYCMDDEDEQWLKAFNSKAEGGQRDGTFSESVERNQGREYHGTA